MRVSGQGAGASRHSGSPAAESAAGTSAPKASTASDTVPADVAKVLVEMAGHAGVIFAGHVAGIARSDAVGFVDVTFRIDQAVRGCPQTGTYVLREWAGLWIGQPERYHTGQRMLMLLTPRGPSGLSAPVNRTDGAIPLLPIGIEPLMDAHGTVAPDEGTEAGESGASAAVDLRWVQARVPRSAVVTPDPAAPDPAAPAPASPDPASPDPGSPGPTSPTPPSVHPIAIVVTGRAATAKTAGDADISSGSQPAQSAPPDPAQSTPAQSTPAQSTPAQSAPAPAGPTLVAVTTVEASSAKPPSLAAVLALLRTAPGGTGAR